MVQEKERKAAFRRIGLAKNSFGFFGTSLWENPNDLFGQLSTSEALDYVTFMLQRAVSGFAPQCLHNI